MYGNSMFVGELIRKWTGFAYIRHMSDLAEMIDVGVYNSCHFTCATTVSSNQLPTRTPDRYFCTIASRSHVNEAGAVLSAYIAADVTAVVALVVELSSWQANR